MTHGTSADLRCFYWLPVMELAPCDICSAHIFLQFLHPVDMWSTNFYLSISWFLFNHCTSLCSFSSRDLSISNDNSNLYFPTFCWVSTLTFSLVTLSTRYEVSFATTYGVLQPVIWRFRGRSDQKARAGGLASWDSQSINLCSTL